MTFEPGKEYKTRDGRRARVYAVDGLDEFAIHGAVLCGNVWKACSWTEDGENGLGTLSDYDLMPPEPEKITRWVVVFADCIIGFLVSGTYLTESAAKNALIGFSDPIAIIPITFHRGEGLK